MDVAVQLCDTVNVKLPSAASCPASASATAQASSAIAGGNTVAGETSATSSVSTTASAVSGAEGTSSSSTSGASTTGTALATGELNVRVSVLFSRLRFPAHYLHALLHLTILAPPGEKAIPESYVSFKDCYITICGHFSAIFLSGFRCTALFSQSLSFTCKGKIEVVARITRSDSELQVQSLTHIQGLQQRQP